MDIPVTICNVIIIQYSDGLVPGYIDGIETFLFFGEPTKADYDMVDEYVTERAEYYGADEAETAAELESPTYGNNKFIELPEGHITTNWEQRL